MKIKDVLKTLREEGIARRFFVMNSFDGLLTVLGVLIAMYLFNEESSRFIILSCMAPAVALMISGIWSAYTIERAERWKELEKIERHMLKSLEKTRIGRRYNFLVIINSLINGLSPLVVSLIVVSPFFLSLTETIPIKTAFYTAFLLISVILFLLGVFVGRIGKGSPVVMGVDMVVVGILIAVIMYLLNRYLIPS